MMGFVLVKLDAGKEEIAFEKIKTLPGVIKVDIVFGRWDLIVSVQAGDLDALTKVVVKNVRATEGVSATETLIATTIKLT